MEIREAVEADAEQMGDIADSPPDVMRNLVHDRTVRVAVDPADGDDADDVLGLVSFDARDDTVHVTQIAGPADVCERLLEEPLGFASREGMTVELLVTDSDDDVRAAVEATGFDSRGAGPTFEGESTTRYRLEPSRAQR